MYRVYYLSSAPGFWGQHTSGGFQVADLDAYTASKNAIVPESEDGSDMWAESVADGTRYKPVRQPNGSWRWVEGEHE